jgi:hypothetical protein
MWFPKMETEKNAWDQTKKMYAVAFFRTRYKTKALCSHSKNQCVFRKFFGLLFIFGHL